MMAKMIIHVYHYFRPATTCISNSHEEVSSWQKKCSENIANSINEIIQTNGEMWLHVQWSIYFCICSLESASGLFTRGQGMNLVKNEEDSEESLSLGEE